VGNAGGHPTCRTRSPPTCHAAVPPPSRPPSVKRASAKISPLESRVIRRFPRCANRLSLPSRPALAESTGRASRQPHIRLPSHCHQYLAHPTANAKFHQRPKNTKSRRECYPAEPVFGGERPHGRPPQTGFLYEVWARKLYTNDVAINRICTNRVAQRDWAETLYKLDYRVRVAGGIRAF